MREKPVPGENCVRNRTMFDKNKISLPQLRIKLGLMENVVKAVNKRDKGFEYWREKIPKHSDAKLKEGIFVGPQIIEIFNDLDCICTVHVVRSLNFQHHHMHIFNVTG